MITEQYIIHQYGGLDSINVESVDIKPKPGEALVEVAYSGINFMDIHTSEGKYQHSTTYPMSLPTGIGVEGAGIVRKVARPEDEHWIGKRVSWCLVWGSHAQHVTVPIDRLIEVPGELSLLNAAASTFHGLTAHYLAHSVMDLSEGDSAVVLAASGGIAQIMIQLMLNKGVNVVALTSTESKRKVLTELGAKNVLLYDEPDLVNAVRSAASNANGEGAEVVFDPIGGQTLRQSFQFAKKFGTIINFGSVSGSVKDLDPIELGEAGSLFLTRPRLADYTATDAIRRWRGKEIFSAILEGTLQLRVGQQYAFSELFDGLNSLASRATEAKPILAINPQLDNA